MANEKPCQHLQTQKPPTRAAILIPGTGDTSFDRGETLTRVLSSQGFAVRELDVEKHDAPLQQLLCKTDTVFDVGGYGGRSLVTACEAAEVAGLYVFQQSTGMFRKVRGTCAGLQMFLATEIFHKSSVVQGLLPRRGRLWHVGIFFLLDDPGHVLTCTQCTAAATPQLFS